ncbi:unnamed protein product, partial [Rotaria sordida]
HTTIEKMEVSNGLNDNINENNTTTSKSNKRKQQMTPSSSQRSTSHPSVKRMKRSKSSQITMTPLKTNFKLPIYLKAHPNLLFRTLRLLLKHTLKKKCERQFLHSRLQLLDQQCRLELRQNLWQSYLNLGTEKEVWPNVVMKMAKTDEHLVCQQFVQKRLNEIKSKYDQFSNELRTQLQSCPVTLLQLQSTLDQHLKELVQIQQKYVATKIQYQLSRYQDMITEIELFQSLSSFPLTSDQQNTINRLIHLQEKQVQFYESLLKLEIRVSIDFLPRSFDELEGFITFDDYFPVVKDTQAIEFKQNYYKIIQKAKRTWLMTHIDAYESEIKKFKHQYENELHQFQLTNSNHGGIHSGTRTIVNSFLDYINRRINRLKEETAYEKIPLYRKQILCVQRRLKPSKKMVTIKPTVIVDLLYHPFTAAQLDYLSRGPSYIRPNPSVFFPEKTFKKRIDRELQDIMKKLKKCMSGGDHQPKIPLNSRLYTSYSDQVQSCLNQAYMTPIPLIDQIRALRELKMVQSIRKKLKKYKLVLRQTDKSGVLHIGSAADYERKAIEYRRTTGAYEELTSNPFNDIICTVTRLLNHLKSFKRIYECQRIKMMPIREKTELAYMYFIPKPHKKGTPLRPILNTIHAASKQISQFLDKLLRPLFDRFVRQTTFVDGADLLEQLQKYIQKGYFNSSTLFITFDITNLYTMLPQEESLAILTEFLHTHNCERINGLSIDTIIELARIVLQANAFVYNNKFYRQIIGGAMGSALTLTLANIFMWKWERQTILPKLSSHELYGRYIDDVFFTSNQCEEKVKELLETANNFHPNIKLEYKIGKSVPFLDVLIQNNNGIFASSLYHKPSAEPTVLSFLSDHPRHVFRNVIQTALTRAVRYSSTFEIFDNERRAIRLMFLYNRYPSNYINQEFEKFFADYITSTSSSILPVITDESQFLALRQKLLNQPTAKQTQLVISAATVQLTQHTQNVTQPNTNTMEATIQRNNEKFKNNIFLHVKHEGRLKGLAREIHMIHDSHFKNTSHGDIRLVVGCRNNPNIEFELSRKRPSSSVLKDPLAKKRKPNEYQQAKMKNKFNQSQQNRKGQNKKKKNRQLRIKKKQVSSKLQFQLATMDSSEYFQNVSTSQVLPKKKILNPMDMTTSSDPTLLLPDYLTISDSKFKDLFLQSTTNNMSTDALIELLNQTEILLFIRELTQLINKFNYSQLQLEQWTFYNNLGMTEGIWTNRVSKKMAEANSMCYTYGRSKNLIKQRLAKYKLQCEKNQETINQCMKQAPLIIDMQTITTMINNLINKDQYELRFELDRRKTMLRLDAEEHKLVEQFYQLKPRQTEINSAKIIWNAINEQHNIIDEMVIFKKWLEVHTQASSFSLQHIQLPNIYHIVTSLFFQGQTSSPEHIAEQTIAKAEQMVQYYNKIINNEKNKLQSTRSHHKNVELLDQTINVIRQREHNMKQRHDYELRGKLANIFNQTTLTQMDIQLNIQNNSTP